VAQRAHIANLISNTDSFKQAQHSMYPLGTEYLSSYIESRGGEFRSTMFVGLQAFLREYLTTPITVDNIDEAEFLSREQGVPFNRKGWIDLLHEALDWRLPQLMGGPVKIWRDLKLGGNDVFNETIVIEVANSAILISVISPRYLSSSSCREELDRFFSAASLHSSS